MVVNPVQGSDFPSRPSPMKELHIFFIDNHKVLDGVYHSMSHGWSVMCDVISLPFIGSKFLANLTFPYSLLLMLTYLCNAAYLSLEHTQAFVI